MKDNGVSLGRKERKSIAHKEEHVLRHQTAVFREEENVGAVGICDSSVGWETQLVKPLVYFAKGFFRSSYFVEISEVWKHVFFQVWKNKLLAYEILLHNNS